MDFPPLYKRVIGLDVYHEQVTACAITSDNGSNTEAVFRQFSTFHNDGSFIISPEIEHLRLISRQRQKIVENVISEKKPYP